MPASNRLTPLAERLKAMTLLAQCQVELAREIAELLPELERPTRRHGGTRKAARTRKARPTKTPRNPSPTRKG